MASIAEQSTPEVGGRGSVLARQKQDHLRLHILLEELAAQSQKRSAGAPQSVYRLVSPHALAEEAVLWPAMRRTVPDGEQPTWMWSLHIRRSTS